MILYLGHFKLKKKKRKLDPKCLCMLLHHFSVQGHIPIPILMHFSRETWVHTCSGTQTLCRRRDMKGADYDWQSTTVPPSPPGHFTVTYLSGCPYPKQGADTRGATKSTFSQCEEMCSNPQKEAPEAALLLKPFSLSLTLLPLPLGRRDTLVLLPEASPPQDSLHCLKLLWVSLVRWDLHLLIPIIKEHEAFLSGQFGLSSQISSISSGKTPTKISLSM